MSYLRSGWDLKYVDAVSEDYVFYSFDEYIEDYGKLTNNGLMDIMVRVIKGELGKDEKVFQEYLIKKLAKVLNVGLRTTPLTMKEQYDRMSKRVKDDKDNKKVD